MTVSASPVRCSMNNCGNMATDSSHIEKVHKIYIGSGVLSRWSGDNGHMRGTLTSATVYLCGKRTPRTKLAPNRYSTLKVSMFGSCVGL